MINAQQKQIAILGSTGSIGTQSLEVVSAFPDQFNIVALTAYSNWKLLASQALKYQPKVVVIELETAYLELKKVLPNTIQVLQGKQALAEVVTLPEIEVVITAVVGYSGLHATLSAIEHKKDIALANKETLVVAGDIVMAAAKVNQVNIYPVDSEHSAIYQCLIGEPSPIEKIILTASGGPFRGKTSSELASVTKLQALKHPNWDMGAKITIDSASLMNKGLEVIEAKWLFDVRPDQIEVVVHPQSIIHSMVEFQDGSIKAQLGLPDMRLPIQYALTYPNRPQNYFPKFSFKDYPKLSFEEPDTATFRNLSLAFIALEKEGNSACILNAANEVAVAQFLEDKVSFLQMSDILEQCMQEIPFIQHPTLSEYEETDKETRILATELITQLV